MIRAARLGAGVWLVVVLTGCSMVSLGYPRLPDLGVLWVQRQVSLEHAQADALKQDLSGLLAWHRQHQLGPTADLLHRWQGMAHTDLSADQVCEEFDTVRGLLRDLARQAVPTMTRLGRSLHASQHQEWAQAQQKSHSEFRETYLDTPRHAHGWARPKPPSLAMPATPPASARLGWKSG